MWDMLLLFWRSCSCLQFSITLSPFCSISMSWAKLVHSGTWEEAMTGFLIADSKM
ncbi:hypothetical protein M758_1G148900 [Ceratodon purpureus]|nr:hypothetical protein M758_1G148900 [Ceratodon purpureus]